MDISIVLIVIVVILVLFLVTTYNRLVTLRQRVKEAWSDIDIQLKRRHDLIPNLVETVKGYAAHEAGTFQAVTQARASAVAAGATGSPQQMAQAENVLSGTLRSLFAVAEAYPQLQVSRSSRTSLRTSPPPRTRSRSPGASTTATSGTTTPRSRRSRPIPSRGCSASSPSSTSSSPTRPTARSRR